MNSETKAKKVISKRYISPPIPLKTEKRSIFWVYPIVYSWIVIYSAKLSRTIIRVTLEKDAS